MTNFTQFPQVFTAENAGGAPPVASAPTDVTLFVGESPDGPLKATPVASFSDYARLYGQSPSLLTASLRAFFDNGGRRAIVLRLDSAPSDRNSFLSALASAFAEGGAADALAFNLLCVPGLTEAPAIAPLQAFCRRKRAFLILDAPQQATVESLLQGLPALTGPDAMNAALYYPWIMTPEGPQPPCGFVAGVYARMDAARGVWKAPAGAEASLVGALDLKAHLDDRQNGLLNPRGVNCLRRFPERGLLVFGARTLDGDDLRGSDWKFIPVRRLALFIESSLAASLGWTIFETNAEPLWARISLAIEGFLHGLFRQGAFQGAKADECFFVRCDATTTTQADIDAGVVNILIGFAALKPAEFVLIHMQTRANAPA
ncbi:phage tail sheath family protein [Methylocystis parvus]|uniref:phage tail sheath family protein n=1 Tax=Methylocystis parvus TaxID=134 RepID=UPI003C760E27